MTALASPRRPFQQAPRSPSNTLTPQPLPQTLLLPIPRRSSVPLRNILLPTHLLGEQTPRGGRTPVPDTVSKSQSLNISLPQKTNPPKPKTPPTNTRLPPPRLPTPTLPTAKGKMFDHSPLPTNLPLLKPSEFLTRRAHYRVRRADVFIVGRCGVVLGGDFGF